MKHEDFMFFGEYDIIVVGGGHAGCEAASASANMGSRVLIITGNINAFAQMSCNPAIGGVGKGQVVREIDALGGKSGIVADLSTIQFRMLNRSKGPAVWSPRSQNDRMLFSYFWKKELEENHNIEFWQDFVVKLLLKGDTIIGLETKMGLQFKAKAIILANGTFLNGKIHIGKVQFPGGRIGDSSSDGLTEQLVSLGFEYGRMKTGTPVRLDGRTINYQVVEEQKGDEIPGKFSFSKRTKPVRNQKSCYITYTSDEVHEILKSGFDESPLFNKVIQGTGPRYCPSIEDKIQRFAERERHQLFIEPDGWDTVEMYLNGFSSSLPLEVQYKAVRKIKGLENVRIIKPGYAIEYDYFPPVQLKKTLETKIIDNLYFCGQINGTTGYEEAAAQGLIAGINAHRKINGLDNFILSRTESYIGVMIDDLVTKGTDEPYRLFTSRSEYRMLLRQDNADIRMTDYGYKIGLQSEKAYSDVVNKIKRIEDLRKILENESMEVRDINRILVSLNSNSIEQKTRMKNILLRPEVGIMDLIQANEKLKEITAEYEQETLDECEILVKYESYINKEKELADRLAKLENIRIPAEINFLELTALSAEAREKFNKVKPETIGQASRISGITPADISVLLIKMGR